MYTTDIDTTTEHLRKIAAEFAADVMPRHTPVAWPDADVVHRALRSVDPRVCDAAAIMLSKRESPIDLDDVRTLVDICERDTDMISMARVLLNDSIDTTEKLWFVVNRALACHRQVVSAHLWRAVEYAPVGILEAVSAELMAKAASVGERLELARFRVESSSYSERKLWNWLNKRFGKRPPRVNDYLLDMMTWHVLDRLVVADTPTSGELIEMVRAGRWANEEFRGWVMELLGRRPGLDGVSFLFGVWLDDVTNDDVWTIGATIEEADEAMDALVESPESLAVAAQAKYMLELACDGQLGNNTERVMWDMASLLGKRYDDAAYAALMAVAQGGGSKSGASDVSVAVRNLCAGQMATFPTAGAMAAVTGRITTDAQRRAVGGVISLVIAHHDLLGLPLANRPAWEAAGAEFERACQELDEVAVDWDDVDEDNWDDEDPFGGR